MNVILLYGDHRHVSAIHGHRHGGRCKNTNIYKMCQDYSMVKIIQCWAKFQLNGKTMSLKILLEVKSCC